MRRLAPLLLVVCVLAVMLGQSAGGVLPQLKATGSLRFCADPQNLPFSSQDRTSRVLKESSPGKSRGNLV